MKPQSAKAKGRNLQKWVVEKLIGIVGVHPEDIKSTSMGAGGEDVILAKAARDLFPYSVECKNVQSLNIWKAYEQCAANSGRFTPIVVFKKNGKKPLVAIDAELFFNIQSDLNSLTDKAFEL